MKPASREKNWLEHRPGLMLAAVFVCVLLHSGSAFGSSVSRGHGFDVDEHSHHCKCGTKCRGSSCCCGPVGTTVRNSASDSVSEGSDADAGPCLNSAPCGDSGLPSAPSFNQHAKIATLSMTGHNIQKRASGLLRSLLRAPCPPGEPVVSISRPGSDSGLIPGRLHRRVPTVLAHSSSARRHVTFVD